MAGVGAESFQAVGDQLAEASDILIFVDRMLVTYPMDS